MHSNFLIFGFCWPFILGKNYHKIVSPAAYNREMENICYERYVLYEGKKKDLIYEDTTTKSLESCMGNCQVNPQCRFWTYSNQTEDDMVCTLYKNIDRLAPMEVSLDILRIFSGPKFCPQACKPHIQMSKDVEILSSWDCVPPLSHSVFLPKPDTHMVEFKYCRKQYILGFDLVNPNLQLHKAGIKEFQILVDINQSNEFTKVVESILPEERTGCGQRRNYRLPRPIWSNKLVFLWKSYYGERAALSHFAPMSNNLCERMGRHGSGLYGAFQYCCVRQPICKMKAGGKVTYLGECCLKKNRVPGPCHGKNNTGCQFNTVKDGPGYDLVERAENAILVPSTEPWTGPPLNQTFPKEAPSTEKGFDYFHPTLVLKRAKCFEQGVLYEGIADDVVETKSWNTGENFDCFLLCQANVHCRYYTQVRVKVHNSPDRYKCRLFRDIRHVVRFPENSTDRVSGPRYCPEDIQLTFLGDWRKNAQLTFYDDCAPPQMDSVWLMPENTTGEAFFIYFDKPIYVVGFRMRNPNFPAHNAGIKNFRIEAATKVGEIHYDILRAFLNPALDGCKDSQDIMLQKPLMIVSIRLTVESFYGSRAGLAYLEPLGSLSCQMKRFHGGSDYAGFTYCCVKPVNCKIAKEAETGFLGSCCLKEFRYAGSCWDKHNSPCFRGVKDADGFKPIENPGDTVEAPGSSGVVIYTQTPVQEPTEPTNPAIPSSTNTLFMTTKTTTNSLQTTSITTQRKAGTTVKTTKKIPACLEVNVHCFGISILPQKRPSLKAESVWKCRLICTRFESCNFFTYSPKKKDCFLLDKITYKETESSVYCGPKADKQSDCFLTDSPTTSKQSGANRLHVVRVIIKRAVFVGLILTVIKPTCHAQNPF